jgi:hypothetical protein
MIRALVASVSLLALVMPAWAVDLILINKSQYIVKELYVSPSKSKKWGPELLGDKAVGTDQQFTITNIPVGVYDLKIVDNDDDSCVVSDVSFSDHSTWTLTDAIVENCESDDD